ncbi:MAG: hypothetical protein DMF69_20800, partial [Acidobacteria bacterium]
MQSGNVNINFANVSTSGVTLTTPLPPSAVGTLPGTFQIANNLAFEITTTASITAPIQVCFNVPNGTAPTLLSFTLLKVMHAENGQLVDRTSSRNFNTRTICAQTNSLSPFAVAEEVDETLPSISGRVTDHAGTGVDGVVIHLSGTLDQLTTTGEDGSYSFVNLTPDGDYSVSPNAPGDFVSPSSALFNGLSGNQTADFIAVDLPTVKFASELTQVSENGGTALVNVLRPSGTTGQVSVSYATSDDSAKAGIDYVSTSGSLTFPDGVSSASILIPLINNSTLDGERLFQVSLTNPTDGLAIALPNPTTVSIFDDEGSTPTASGLGKTVTLGNVSVTYTNISVAGLTLAVTIDPNSVASAPNGYTITGPAYEVSTSATYTAPVNVCISLPSITDATTFSHLKILHGETDSNNQPVLVDRTTGLDFANHAVCSSVSSLSAFVIAQANSPISARVSVSGLVTTLAGLPVSGATITLSGAESGFSVTDNQGHYSFPNLATNTSYTVTPSLVNYSFTPGSRTFSLIANKLDADFLAISNAVPSANPIDNATFFVRQHYLDFLGREPDASGLAFWTNEITSCG